MSLAAKFGNIIDNHNEFVGNLVTEALTCLAGVAPKFSDLELIVLSATAEAFGYNSENCSFNQGGRTHGVAVCRLRVNHHQIGQAKNALIQFIQRV